MNSEKIQCANDTCQCVVTAVLEPGVGSAAEAYCSGYCGDAATGEESDLCACGHPPCDEP